jgi:DNA helicase IV
MKHPSLYQFETVGRIGDEVLEIGGTTSQRLNRVAEEISAMLDRYQTIAIVGKSTAECDRLYQHFRSLITDIVLITDGTDLEGRVVIIPIHLVGGLEFDAVVIMDHVQYDIEDILKHNNYILVLPGPFTS